MKSTNTNQIFLGQRGKTSLLVSLRKHATQLKKLVDTYQKRRAQYHVKYPTHQLPEDIDYAGLLQISADHPFWNDSIFTNIKAPWANDSNTKDGMRQLAYVDRAREELRRLGWEVRRLMRWATTSHDRIWKCLVSSQNMADEISPLNSFFTHQTLSSLPPETRLTATRVILKNEFVRISNLQLLWNTDVLEVFDQTRSQAGDQELKTKWLDQIDHITTLWKENRISMVPGHLDTPYGIEGIDFEDIDDDLHSLEGDISEHEDGDGLMDALDLEEIQAAVNPATLMD